MSQDFVEWFHGVAPYIHAHRGKRLVVAIPGDAFLGDAFVSLSHDLGLLSSLGISLVLVPGARAQIEAALKKAGIKTTYHRDIRVTTPAALSVIKGVIGKMVFDIEARLSIGAQGLGLRNAALNVASGNYLLAKPLGVIEGVDYLHSGTVRKVDAKAIQSALSAGQMALVSPIGYSPSGEVFNLHYEEVAARVSIALGADKLIYLTNSSTTALLPKNGEYTITQLEAYLKALPAGEDKVQAVQMLEPAMTACREGTDRIHLVPLSIPGGLLLELFTHCGAGMMIAKDPAETIRQATLDDIAGLLRLIEPLEQQGALVQRSRQQLEVEIDRFTVLDHDHDILGCMALYPLDETSAELACFVVRPMSRRGGYGARMLAHIRVAARDQGIEKLFVLTTQAVHWFIEQGFRQVDIEALPAAKRALYNEQRASKVLVCDLSPDKIA